VPTAADGVDDRLDKRGADAAFGMLLSGELNRCRAVEVVFQTPRERAAAAAAAARAAAEQAAAAASLARNAAGETVVQVRGRRLSLTRGGALTPMPKLDGLSFDTGLTESVTEQLFRAPPP